MGKDKKLEDLNIDALEYIIRFLEPADAYKLRELSKVMKNQLQDYIEPKKANYAEGNTPFLSFKDKHSKPSIYPLLNFLALQLACAEFVRDLPNKKRLTKEQETKFVKILNQGVVLNTKMVEFINNTNPACAEIINKAMDAFVEPDIKKIQDIKIVNVRNANGYTLAYYYMDLGLGFVKDGGDSCVEFENRAGSNILSLITTTPALLERFSNFLLPSTVAKNLDNLLPSTVTKAINTRKEELKGKLNNGPVNLPIYSSKNPITAIAYYLILKEALDKDDHELFATLNELHVLYDTKLVIKPNCKTALDNIEQGIKKRLTEINLDIENFPGLNLHLSPIDNMHHTPLTYSIHCNEIQATKDLIKAGADVNAMNSDGNRPIHFAVRGVRTEQLKILLAAGADVHARDNAGYTPLNRTVMSDNQLAAEILIKAGANPHLLDNTAIAHTPLRLAIQNHKNDMVECLIKAGVNVNTIDQYGDTLLHVAIKYKNFELVERLIKLGADVNIKDKEGDRAPIFLFNDMDHYYNQKSITAFNALISAGADIESKNKEGFTPLLYYFLYSSYHKNNIVYVNALINGGAKIDSRTILSATDAKTRNLLLTEKAKLFFGIKNNGLDHKFKNSTNRFINLLNSTTSPAEDTKPFYNLLSKNTHKMMKALSKEETDLFINEMTASLKALNIKDEDTKNIKDEDTKNVSDALKLLIKAKNLESNSKVTRNLKIGFAVITLLLATATLGLIAGKNIGIFNQLLNSLSHRAQTSKMFGILKSCLDLANTNAKTKALAIIGTALTGTSFTISARLEHIDIRSKEARNFNKFLNELDRKVYARSK